MSRSFRELGFRCYEYDIVHGAGVRSHSTVPFAPASSQHRQRQSFAGDAGAAVQFFFSCSRPYRSSADGALSMRTASKVSQCWRPRKSPHRQCVRPLCAAIDPSSGCAWPPLVPREPSLLQAMAHPRLHQLAASAHVRTVVIDFCQYKTRWKKPTRLSFGNLDLQDVERFGKRRCLGRHGLCSRAGLPHMLLSGSAPARPLSRFGLCVGVVLHHDRLLNW